MDQKTYTTERAKLAHLQDDHPDVVALQSVRQAALALGRHSSAVQASRVPQSVKYSDPRDPNSPPRPGRLN